MPHSLHIEFEKFHDPVLLPKNLSSKKAIFEKKESSRFFHQVYINEWMKGYEESGKHWNRFFEVIEKVIAVVISILSILMPLATHFLPAWVPWGIGLPTILLLSYAQSKVQTSIATNAIDAEYVPFFKEFIDKNSYRALHPIGVHDLPQKKDPRLKSDQMMRWEAEKTGRYSAQRIEEITGIKSRKKARYDLPDLELSSYVQKYAATEFTSGNQLNTFRTQVKEAKAELSQTLRYKDAKAFNQKLASLEKVVQGCDSLLLPTLSAKDHTRSLLTLYKSAYERFIKTQAIYLHWTNFYSRYCPEQERDFWPWDAYLADCKTIEGQFKSVIKEFKPLEEKEKELTYALYKLIEQSKSIERQLTNRIDQLPFIKHLDIGKRLAAFAEDHLSSTERILLVEWMKGHKKSSDEIILKIEDQIENPEDKFPKEKLTDWFSHHPDSRHLTSNELLEQSDAIQEAVLEANKLYSTIGEQLVADPTSEQFEANKKIIETFETDTLNPLQELINREGRSKGQDLLKLLFFKIPTQPFYAVNPFDKKKDPLLYKRRVEEIRLDRQLQAIDQSMVTANQARIWGLRAPIILLYVIEGIVSIYFSNPWIFCAFSVATLLLEGGSHYVNYRLKGMEKQKNAVKLQYKLRDRPHIGSIPGNRPELARLKEIQDKYGLEGVEPTWARVLAEGGDVLPTSQKDMLKVAEEGSAEATHYLQNSLILLKGKVVPLKEKPEEEWTEREKNWVTRIESIEGVLDPEKAKEETPKPKPDQPSPEELERKKAHEHYEAQVNQLAVAEQKLDQLATEKIGVKRWIKELEKEYWSAKISEGKLERLLGKQWQELFVESFWDASFVCKDKVSLLLEASKGKREVLKEGESFDLTLAIRFGNSQLLKTQTKEKLISIARHIANLERIYQAYSTPEAIYQQITIKSIERLFLKINIKLSKAVPDDLKIPFDELWKKYREEIESLFKELSSPLQGAIFKEMPEPFQNAFTPFYSEYIGLTFYNTYSPTWSTTQTIDAWLAQHPSFEADFQKIGPAYQNNLLKQLPPFLQTHLKTT